MSLKKKLQNLVLDAIWDWNRDGYRRQCSLPLDSKEFKSLCEQENTLAALAIHERLTALDKRIELLGLAALEEEV